MNNDTKDLKTRVKNLLAEQLGVSAEDINDEDSFEGDLRLQPTEISDFIKTLEENDIDISKIDLVEIETFSDLIENLVSNELVD